MNKKIYITEEQLNSLMRNSKDEEVTFYEFFVNAKSFLKDLLTKPTLAEPSSLFSKNGISKDELLKSMEDLGILKKEEEIDEVAIEEGKKHPFGNKMVAKHFVTYKVSRNRFFEKMKELYKELFTESFTAPRVFKNEDEEVVDKVLDSSNGEYETRGGFKKETLEEDGGDGGASSCGSVMQSGGNPDAGQFIAPIGHVQRRRIYQAKEEE